MVICLERGAVLHMVQLMPLPLTVSCFSKIQIGFTFLVPAHTGNPGQRAVKRVCDWIKVGRRLRFTFCLVSISYFRYFAALRMIWLNDSVTSGLPIDLTT